MRSFIRNLLRSVIGPRSVASCVSDIQRTVDDLKFASEVNRETAEEYGRLSVQHFHESRRADEVAAKLGNLIS